MDTDRLRIAYIGAGAAGMICGSCLRDNALVAALQRKGCDAVLIPTYTPLRVDEEDVSLDQVFFGGINVFLQHTSAIFRRLPRPLRRYLDHPALLKRVAAGNIPTEPRLLGDLTLSMLEGSGGLQSDEVKRLTGFLERSHRPHLVNLTNLLISGVVAEIKARLGVPVVATLQGDDLFLKQLQEPYRARVLEQIKRIVPALDGFIVFNRFYGEKMASMLDIPAAKIHLVPLGLNTDAYPVNFRFREPGKTLRLGYLARVCPEKGLGVLVESFIKLKRMDGMERLELHAAGWLGAEHRLFFDGLRAELTGAGLASAFQYHGVLDHSEKREFLRSLDLFCVPAVHEEPKGLYVLEALASGVPVVEPDQGAFPELLEEGGGVLFRPGDASRLADTLFGLLRDPELRQTLAREGHRRVHRDLTAMRMAERTLQVYRAVLEQAPQ